MAFQWGGVALRKGRHLDGIGVRNVAFGQQVALGQEGPINGDGVTRQCDCTVTVLYGDRIAERWRSGMAFFHDGVVRRCCVG